MVPSHYSVVLAQGDLARAQIHAPYQYINKYTTRQRTTDSGQRASNSKQMSVECRVVGEEQITQLQ
jgi:hypothetical protein